MVAGGFIEVVGNKMALQTKKELNLPRKKSSANSTINLDGKDFDTSNMSTLAEAQLNNLKFVNEQILQINNELQIADSARIIHSNILKAELIKTAI